MYQETDLIDQRINRAHGAVKPRDWPIASHPHALPPISDADFHATNHVPHRIKDDGTFKSPLFIATTSLSLSLRLHQEYLRMLWFAVSFIALSLVQYVIGTTNSTPEASNPQLTNIVPNGNGPVLYYNGSGPVPPYDMLSPIPAPLPPLT